MPCNSDYMEPSTKERELQRTAILLDYVYIKTGGLVSSKLIRDAANIYCRTDYVAELCDVLTKLPKHERDELVYNARNKTARDLADWWEEHRAADAARDAQERADAERIALRKSALKKLTPAERAALGLH